VLLTWPLKWLKCKPGTFYLDKGLNDEGQNFTGPLLTKVRDYAS